MNLLDVIILSSAGAAAVGGWRLGFLARVVSWIGMVFGLVVAARFLPSIVRTFEGPDPSSKLLIAGVVLLGGAFVGQGLGLLAGSSLRRFVPLGPVAIVDSAVGAFIGTLGVLASFWLLLPAIADVPGDMARLARSSAVAQFLDDSLPPPPDTLQVLRRVVGDTNFPKVFDGLQRSPEVGPPPESTGIPVAVLERAVASTVRVTGEACGRVQQGSGFSPVPDVVVTNAHVVAGHRPGRTEVERPDGRTFTASVVVFDPARDLAVLRVPGLGQPALPVGDADEGDRVAVMGHPGGQEQLRIAPAAISQQVEAVGRDLYDSRSTRRDVFILAAALRPGDSGAALVDADGTAVGVAFAIAPDRPGTAYAVTDTELRAVLSQPRTTVISTGPCLTSS